MKKIFFTFLTITITIQGYSQTSQQYFHDLRNYFFSLHAQSDQIKNRFWDLAQYSSWNSGEHQNMGQGNLANNWNDIRNRFEDLEMHFDFIRNYFSMSENKFDDIGDLLGNFDGTYGSLSGLPSLFDGSFSSLSGTPTTLAGYGITDAFDGSYPSLTNRIFYYDSNNNNGVYSNQGNTATGTFSFAIGRETSASGSSAVSLNYQTAATGNASLAIGSSTQSIGENSFAGGLSTQSTGYSSAALGRETVASGNHSLSIGQGTNSHAFNSVALGQYNSVSNNADPDTYLTTNTAFVIGNGTADNARSNAFKVMFSGDTYVSGSLYLEGSAITSTSAELNILDGVTATTAELNLLDGVSTIGDGILASVTENGNTGVRLSTSDAANHGDIGNNAVDLSNSSFASTTTGATGYGSTAMGFATTASGAASTVMGFESIASGLRSAAMGFRAYANGDYSTAIGEYTLATGGHSTAMGSNATASGDYSTAMGWSTTASGVYSTAMGRDTTASGETATATGQFTSASGKFSLSSGLYSNASGTTSVALGNNTIADGYGTLATGYFNTANANPQADSFDQSNTAFVIGNGTFENRSNAFKVLFDGTTTIAGDLSINSDARLKANIVSLGATLSKLLKIDGKSYTMKKDESEKQKIGLLAQDIEKVFPELVSESNGVKSVNYQGLVPVLINALKEQEEKIKSQENKLLKLESLVQDLIDNQ